MAYSRKSLKINFSSACNSNKAPLIWSVLWLLLINYTEIQARDGKQGIKWGTRWQQNGRTELVHKKSSLNLAAILTKTWDGGDSLQWLSRYDGFGKRLGLGRISNENKSLFFISSKRSDWVLLKDQFDEAWWECLGRKSNDSQIVLGCASSFRFKENKFYIDYAFSKKHLSTLKWAINQNSILFQKTEKSWAFHFVSQKKMVIFKSDRLQFFGTLESPFHNHEFLKKSFFFNKNDSLEKFHVKSVYRIWTNGFFFKIQDAFMGTNVGFVNEVKLESGYEYKGLLTGLKLNYNGKSPSSFQLSQEWNFRRWELKYSLYGKGRKAKSYSFNLRKSLEKEELLWELKLDKDISSPRYSIVFQTKIKLPAWNFSHRYKQIDNPENQRHRLMAKGVLNAKL